LDYKVDWKICSLCTTTIGGQCGHEQSLGFTCFLRGRHVLSLSTRWPKSWNTTWTLLWFIQSHSWILRTFGLNNGENYKHSYSINL
jgi:hypothetical protein